MQRTLSLAAIVTVILLAGGCQQPRTMQPPLPIVATPADDAVNMAPPPAVTEINSPAPEAPAPAQVAASTLPAVAPPPVPAIVANTEVETKKTAATVAVKAKPAPAPATAALPAPPKTVSYKATNGTVIFNHQQHSVSHPCKSCHPAAPPAKIAINKEKAHLLCKGCHQQNGSGPTQCSGCHKKS